MHSCLVFICIVKKWKSIYNSTAVPTSWLFRGIISHYCAHPPAYPWPIPVFPSQPTSTNHARDCSKCFRGVASCSAVCYSEWGRLKFTINDITSRVARKKATLQAWGEGNFPEECLVGKSVHRKSNHKQFSVLGPDMQSHTYRHTHTYRNVGMYVNVKCE